jgi:glycosyltransferase involved in cell wall biosynthesis
MREAAVLAAPCVVGADGNRDGMPTVLLEAMALGTPCIATPVTGIPEIVQDGATGLLVEERDAGGLAEGLHRLLGDAVLRERLARAARQRIERDFDIHKNAARLRELLPHAATAPAPRLRRAS